MAKKRKKTGSAADVPWLIHYFQRHRDDDATRAVPARQFLADCPKEVRAHLAAVLNAVAESPPPRFSGGLQ